MTTLGEKLTAARNEVARLERLAATATCAEIGHDMQSIGGANCGCPGGDCSVPVHECTRCRESDYGENDDARETRRLCAERRAR